jgi:hypothetical protein
MFSEIREHVPERIGQWDIERLLHLGMRDVNPILARVFPPHRAHIIFPQTA